MTADSSVSASQTTATTVQRQRPDDRCYRREQRRVRRARRDDHNSRGPESPSARLVNVRPGSWRGRTGATVTPCPLRGHPRVKRPRAHPPRWRPGKRVVVGSRAPWGKESSPTEATKRRARSLGTYRDPGAAADSPVGSRSLFLSRDTHRGSKVSNGTGHGHGARARSAWPKVATITQRLRRLWRACVAGDQGPSPEVGWSTAWDSRRGW